MCQLFACATAFLPQQSALSYSLGVSTCPREYPRKREGANKRDGQTQCIASIALVRRRRREAVGLVGVEAIA